VVVVFVVWVKRGGGGGGGWGEGVQYVNESLSDNEPNSQRV